MKVSIEVDEEDLDRIVVEVLRSWYEDAMLDEDIGKVLAALLTVIEYASLPEEFQARFTSLQ